MTTTYNWELWCVNEAKYLTVWNTITPTTCPNNSTHTIQNPHILETVSTQTTKIVEELVPTQGYFQFKGFKLDIPAGSPGNITTTNVSWPRPTTLLNGWFLADSTNKGDTVSANITATVGAIGAPVSVGATSIVVSPTVLENVAYGYTLQLTDLVNEDNLGEILQIYSGNSTVVTSKASTHTYSATSPTYVQTTIKLIESLYIPMPGRYEFAEKKIGGKTLPARLPMTVEYQNQNGNAKVFAFNLEYLY